MRWTRATRSAACSLVAWASAAHATATPEAQRVIDRYLDATGGRAAFAAERVVHQRATAHGFGLEGTAESWLVQPDRQYTIAHLGPLTIEQGVAGARAWHRIAGSPLQWSDGKDLDADLADAWFEAERWCEPDHGGGDVALAPADAPRQPGGETLRITPPRGAARLVEFDAHGFAVRATTKRDQLTMVFTSGEYRLDAGRVRPHREEQQVVESPANALRLDITFTEANVAVPDSLFAPAAATAREFAPGASRVVAAMAPDAPVPMVRASLNGAAPAWFLIDTGSTLSALDSVYAASLGLQGAGTVQVQGVGAQAAIHLVRLDSLTITGEDDARFVVRGMHCTVTHFGDELAEGQGPRLAGILGGDVLARAVIDLDFDAGTVGFVAREAYAPPPGADTLRLVLGNGVPVTEATLDSADTGLFRLDSGSANGVDLHRAFAAAHDVASRAACAVHAEALGLGGAVALRYFRARALTLGARTVRVPLASTSASAVGAFASEDYAGNIGVEILRHFRCAFDYEGRRAYLAPSQAFGDTLRRDDGLALVPERAGWRVLAAVRRGGPHAGDLLEALDGETVCVLSSRQLASRLDRADGKVRLALRTADGRAREIRYTP